MLAPEELVRFKVVVPSQQEVELVKALAKLKSVHLEHGIFGLEIVPPLLIAAEEGRLDPQSLDVEESLRTLRKVLKPGSEILAKFEDLYAEFYNLQRLRQIIGALAAERVPLESIGKVRLRSVMDIVVVSDENFNDAVADISKNAAVLSVSRLLPDERLLLIAYSIDNAKAVKELKERYGKRVPLPAWFSGDPSTVLKRLDQEEMEVKRRMIIVLAEAAAYLRGILDVKRVERIEILSNAHKSVEQLGKLVEEAERTILDAAALSAASKVAKGIAKLSIKGLSELLEALNKDEALTPENFKDILQKLNIEINSLTELLDRRSMLLSAKSALEKLSTVEENATLVLSCFRRNVILDASVARKFAKLLLSYGGVPLVKDDVGDYCSIVLQVTPEKALALAGELRSLLAGEIAGPFPGKDLASIKAKISARLDGVRFAVAARVIRAVASLERDQVLAAAHAEILQLFEELRRPSEGAEIPAGEWWNTVMSVAEAGKRAASSIERAKELLNSIAELPPESAESELERVVKELRGAVAELKRIESYAWFIEVFHKAYPFIDEVTLFRKRGVAIIEGYVPAKLAEHLKRSLQSTVELLYFEAENVPRTEPAPTYIEHRGLLKLLYAITEMRGVPAYWEVDPTLVFSTLFALMFGMMFGDIGQGLLIVAFGAWLLKTRRRILGISERGAESLGALSLLAGAASVAFGFLYGCPLFLVTLTKPVISPIHDIPQMLTVALLFGFAQMIIGMLLNIVTLLRREDTFAAVASSYGAAGVLFYASGAMLVYRLASSNFSASYSELAPLLALVVLALMLTVVYGVHEARRRGLEGAAHALGGVIELLIALPANSFSYARLAAFAIAHEAFRMLAEAFAASGSLFIGLAVSNVLSLGIEGLAVGIQSLRLLYYEFSTKFYSGTGIEFRPLA